MQTKIDTIELGRLCADAISELQMACKKHPEWPTALTNYLDLDDLKELVPSVRWCNENDNPSAQSILDEEYYEFLEAVMEGNAKAARNEIVQTIAMLLRHYAHMEDYIAQHQAAARYSETALSTPKTFDRDFQIHPVDPLPTEVPHGKPF